MNNQYLLPDRPLTVLPSLIMLVGIERALILQQLHFACQQPKSGKILTDGFKYIWNTYQEWHEEFFPFWKPENIQKHFLKLEKEELAVSCQPNLKNGDATKYYRVNEEKLLQIAAEKGIINQSQPHSQPELMMGSTRVDDGVNQSKPSYKEQNIHTEYSTESSQEADALTREENASQTETSKENPSTQTSDTLSTQSAKRDSLNELSAPRLPRAPVAAAVPVNPDAGLLLESWLDRIAETLQVKSRFQLADFEKWERACMKAIDDDRELGDFIEIIKQERDRLQNEMQYFSANNCLKILQTAPRAVETKSEEVPDADRIADIERRMREGLNKQLQRKQQTI